MGRRCMNDQHAYGTDTKNEVTHSGAYMIHADDYVTDLDMYVTDLEKCVIQMFM